MRRYGEKGNAAACAALSLSRSSFSCSHAGNASPAVWRRLRSVVPAGTLTTHTHRPSFRFGIVSSVSPSTPSAAQPTPETPAAAPKTCLLCDAAFTSFHRHCEEPAHIARTAICQYFVMPDRSESLMQHLERHIQLDLREVDALTLRKVERRRRRLLAGLLHLVEEGALKDALPTFKTASDATEEHIRASSGGRAPHQLVTLSVSTDRFLTRLLLGESYMRREVVDRTARLVPSLTAVELDAVATYLMSTRQLARLFDELSLQKLLTAAAEKAAVLEAQEEDKETKRSDAPTDNTVDGAVKATTVGGNGSSARSRGDDSTNAVSQGGGENCAVATSADNVMNANDGGSADTFESTRAAKVAQTSLWRLSRDEKASILLACIGELEHFNRQDRPRSVLSKLAADALVLNVVATHARDNLISELVHEALQRIIEEGTPVWRRHQQNMQQQQAAEEAKSLASAETVSGDDAGISKEVRRRFGVSSGKTGAPKLTVDELSRRAHAATLSTSSTPHPPTAGNGSSLPDAATAEQMLSSYLAFQDVDGTQPDVGEAQSMSANTFGKQHWQPLERELSSRAAYFQGLALAKPYPRIRS